jgi:hypothetical protein
VLDTRQDDETVRMACLKPEFYEADLIIGPVYNNNLKIAAAYAQKYEIPIVSPLSPAENLTSDNKYFFMANPGLTMHCKKLIEYVSKNYPNENIILVHQKNDEDIAQIFRNQILRIAPRIIKHDLLYTYGKYTDINGQTAHTDLKSRLKGYGYNIILVASLDLQFAHKLSRELFNLSNDYHFVVMGLPIWNPENDLRIDYLEKINTHFTLASYLADTCYFASSFARHFNEIFGHYPNEINYKGFDIGYFFGKALALYGQNFYDEIENIITPAHHTDFMFRKSYTEGSYENETRFLYYENHNVMLFRYNNYTLQRLK